MNKLTKIELKNIYNRPDEFRLTVWFDDPDENFGESIAVYLGESPKSVVLAFMRLAENLLKYIK